MGNKLFYISAMLMGALLLNGCATSSSQPPPSSPPSPPSPQSAPSGGPPSQPSTQSTPPGSSGSESTSAPSEAGTPGSPGQSPPSPGQSETESGMEDGGDQDQADASPTEDIPLEETEGEMAGADAGLEGLGVEDAAGDEVLEEALEVFDAAGAAAQEGDSGSEPGEDVMLEDTGSTQAGNEAESGGDPASGDGGRPGAQSEAEELATLNRALDNALERFDGNILTERDTIANQENINSGGLADGEMDGEAGEMEDADGTGTGASGTTGGDPGDSGDGAAPASPGSRRQGDNRHTASAETIPDDIPDGSNDDVVARQIREAAMAETDPELREKLWEEYRKYKQN
jgi:hypothetical protein